MPDNSDARLPTREIINALKGIFKKYTRTARKRAWERVTSPKGDALVHKIITNPSVPTPGIDRLTFRDWLEHNA